MSIKPFLSKEVQLKRVWKGFAIAFPVVIMIFVIGNHYVNLIDDTLRNHYVGEKQNKVLGVEDSEPKLIGSYGDVSEDDTFVWEWDQYWDREGYYKLERFVEDPEYFSSKRDFALTDKWELRNGYELSISCKKLDMTEVVAGDTYPCTLSYNNQILTEGVRFESYCKEYKDYRNCHGHVNFRVFSDTFGDPSSKEYLIFSEYASGSKDWIYVYRLENGKAILLPFVINDSQENSYYISGYAYDLYGLFSSWENMYNFNDPIELVTYFHEPSMGSDNNVEGYYDIWDVTEENVVFKEKVVDLYRKGEPVHWL